MQQAASQAPRDHSQATRNGSLYPDDTYGRKQPAVTAILRCYGRPIRTRRMLDCILKQTFTDFELLMMGDGCPQFDELIKSDYFKEYREKFNKKNKFRVYHFNNPTGPHKDWGACITFNAIKMAMGKYTIILDNDDMLLKEHIDFYYHSIARHENDAGNGTADFVYNRTHVHNAGNHWVRDPSLEFGKVGHQEIIVRTEFLKTMPKEQPVYNQDWLLIEQMMKTGRAVKGVTQFPTHYIMSIQTNREPGFETDI